MNGKWIDTKKGHHLSSVQSFPCFASSPSLFILSHWMKSHGGRKGQTECGCHTFTLGLKCRDKGGIKPKPLPKTVTLKRLFIYKYYMYPAFHGGYLIHFPIGLWLPLFLLYLHLFIFWHLNNLLLHNISWCYTMGNWITYCGRCNSNP